VTDQPPSQPPPQEPESEAPATPAPDGALTEVAPAAPPPAPVGAAGPVAPAPAFAVEDPGVGGVTTSDFAPASGGGGSLFPADRPEMAIGAAFAGGLVLALIVKRLAR
jgi:hypothetical protein